MIRARNPISGEATPREGKGEPILNPEWQEREISTFRKKEKPLTEKIGAISSRYDCLGNSPSKAASSSRMGSRAESRCDTVAISTAVPLSSRNRVPVTLPTPKCAPQNLKFDAYGFVIDDEYDI